MQCELKKILHDRKITQREFSIKLGITERTLQTWFNGKNVPALDKAIKAAELLECSVYDIWKGNENES